MSNPGAPPIRCVDCDYIAIGRWPSRAMVMHRKRKHMETSDVLRRAAMKFGPLIEATGNYVNAIEAGDLLHVWPEDEKPDMATFKKWANEWEANKDQGIVPAGLEGMVHGLAQQLRAVREYAAWKMIHTYAQAGNIVAQGIIDGKKYTHVEPKYLADGISMMVRDVAGAFGTPKPTRKQRNMTVRSLRTAPAQKALPAGDTVTGEFRVVEADHAAG